MPTPQKELVSLEATPYHHVVSRCVRRAFLRGFEALTGRSDEYHRERVAEPLRELDSVIAVDICACAVMPNHSHPVLRLAPEQAESGFEAEVIDRRRRVLHSLSASNDTSWAKGNPSRRISQAESSSKSGENVSLGRFATWVS